MENTESIFKSLDELLNNTDLSEVSADSQIYSELKDGYYLVEVEKAELKESKSSHLPMASFQFKITEDGYTAELTDDNTSLLIPVKNSKNKKIFMNYVLKDENSLKRFVIDMLKFEGETEGTPFFEKEAFTNSELLSESLPCLEGLRIYLQVSTSEKDDGTKSTWNNLISWKRAKALELPL